MNFCARSRLNNWQSVIREARLRAGSAHTDVIAPSPAERFTKTNDNSVAILLT